MHQPQHRVAVITGAASGIGRGLAERALPERLHLVLADRDGEALESLAARLREQGVQVLAQVTDVTDAAQLESLRDAAVPPEAAEAGRHVGAVDRGQAVARLELDRRNARRLHRRGELGYGKWLRSLTGQRIVLPYFSFEDPVPALAELWLNVRRGLSRPRRILQKVAQRGD